MCDGLVFDSFFFNDTATTEIYTLSLHDALPIFPRDLKVLIPGYGINKINAAYSLGGADLTAKTIKSLFGEDFKINHIINVNFGGFREVVDELGCVYADVDRRYYHSNLGLPVSQHYAEI